MAPHAVRRWRLDEPAWQGWIDAAAAPDDDAPPTPVAPVAPLEGTVSDGTVPPDDLARDAVRLVAGGPLQVQVTSTLLGSATGRSPLGLLARLGSDGLATGGVVRRLVPGPADEPESPLGALPGVEVSATPAAALGEEILRLLPPDTGWDDPPAPLRAAPEIVRAAVGHAREGADDQLAALCRLQGWDDLPPMLEGLLTLRGDATIVVAAPGRPAEALRLLFGSRGWVELGLASPTDVTHRAVDRGEVHRRLAATLTPLLVSLADGRGGAR